MKNDEKKNPFVLSTDLLAFLFWLLVDDGITLLNLYYRRKTNSEDDTAPVSLSDMLWIIGVNPITTQNHHEFRMSDPHKDIDLFLKLYFQYRRTISLRTTPEEKKALSKYYD